MPGTERVRASERRLVGAIAALAVLAGVAYLVLAWRVVGRAGLPLDDSWIHLEFARRLAEGSGLAFGQGPRVAGTTAPLWTALLAALALLPGPAQLWSQLLGLGLQALAVIVFHRFCRELGLGSGLAVFATFQFGVCGYLIWGSVSGLEIPLFVLLTLMGMRLHLRDRHTRRGIAVSLPVIALSVLARPEGLLLLVLALADRALASRGNWRDWWRGAWPGALVAVVCLLPVALFNLAVSGSLAPTTWQAKSGAVNGYWPSLRYLHTALGVFFRSQPWLTLLAGAGGLLLLRRIRTPADRGLLPILWLLGLPVAYSCLHAPTGALVGNFGRYLYPLLPFVILLGCLGLELIVERLPRRGPAWIRMAMVGVALLVAVPTVRHAVTLGGQFARNVRNVEQGDVAAARWLSSRLPAGARLAVNDVGAVQYHFPEAEIVDLAGIMSPEIHDYTAAAVREGQSWEVGAAHFLEAARPDYLVVFPSWFPGLLASGVSFAPIREFVIDDNITLGGDRLVVYSTPWTRMELRQ